MLHSLAYGGTEKGYVYLFEPLAKLLPRHTNWETAKILLKMRRSMFYVRHLKLYVRHLKLYVSRLKLYTRRFMLQMPHVKFQTSRSMFYMRHVILYVSR